MCRSVKKTVHRQEGGGEGVNEGKGRVSSRRERGDQARKLTGERQRERRDRGREEERQRT